MGSKNNQATAVMESEQGNIGVTGEAVEKERETGPVKMDNNHYLGLGKSTGSIPPPR
jgi:hypothetical protein